MNAFEKREQFLYKMVIFTNRDFSLSIMASKINVTPKGVRLSKILQLTAALCNEM